VFNDPQDRYFVESELDKLRVHPEEVRRLAELGDAVETIGQALVDAVRRGDVAKMLTADLDDPQFMVMNVADPSAAALERSIAVGIGRSGQQSPYDRLYIGGTAMDAPTQPNVIHINTMPEDMRFPAQGPRILMDGKTIPLPDDFLKSIEGLHIPYDLGLTPRLVVEMFRTLQSGGMVKYAYHSR
jgi:hypothetical protein